MRLRRCAIVTVEPRERTAFDLTRLAEGGTGVHRILEWIAHVPQVAGEILLDDDELRVLGTLSPSEWVEVDALAHHPRDAIDRLLEKGLLVVEASAAADKDGRLRAQHWRALSAVMHYASRWQGVDTEAAERDFNEVTGGTLLDRIGAAPPEVRERANAAQRMPLARPPESALDRLLDARVTCRNFDATRKLSRDAFGAVLYRTFGARTVDDYAPGVRLIKKGVPSAGCLHPTEAYLLVQHVEGVAPGLYHYHPVDHALEPMRMLTDAESAAIARRFVAAQRYLLDAHVFVIAASRFGRNFWKYRDHAKAYRTLILDVGHLSQTLYLAATELGLGAFITAAVNEIDIEGVFGLDPLEEGPLAVCGFGIRAAVRGEVEFDPLHKVWNAR